MKNPHRIAVPPIRPECRAPDNLEYVGSGGLLFTRLSQFAGKGVNFPLKVTSRYTGDRRFPGLWPCRTTAVALYRFSASTASLHVAPYCGSRRCSILGKSSL